MRLKQTSIMLRLLEASTVDVRKSLPLCLTFRKAFSFFRKAWPRDQALVEYVMKYSPIWIFWLERRSGNDQALASSIWK